MPIVMMPDGTAVEMPDNPSLQELSALQQVLAAGEKGGVREGFREAGRVLDKTVRKGLTALPAFIGDSALATMRNMRDLPSIPNPLMLPGMIDKAMDPQRKSAVHNTKWGDVQQALETGAGLAPPVSQPQTEIGKATANVLEPVVSAAAGGGLANLGQRAGIGLASGVGGELAARATDDNPLARAAGSLVGGGAAGVVGAWRPNATELVQDATKSMRPSDWKKAKVLEEILKKEGLPHLKSQLLGPRSTLDDVIGAASSNPSVRPKMVTAMSNAPKEVEELVNLKSLGNLPPTIGERGQALDDVQQAAQNSIRNLKTKSNDAFVKAMPPETLNYPPARVESLYNQLQALAKSPKYGETSDAGKAIRRYAEDLVAGTKAVDPADVLNPTVVLRAQKAGIPLEKIAPPQEGQKEFVTNAHKINNLIKEMNAKVSASPDYLGLPVADVKKIMVAGTPEFNAAREAKQISMVRDVNPVKKSLVGQIAEMGGGVKPDKVTAKDSAIDLTFNRGLKPQEIVKLADHIGGDGVGALLREHISKTMQKTWPSDLKRTEQTVNAPAHLVDALAGSNWKRQNINAALEVTAKASGANPQEVQKGFYQLVKALETYKDVKLASGVSPGQTAQTAGTNLPGALAEPFGTTRRVFGAQATTKTYDKLADLILAPDGLKQLEALGRAPAPERLKALAISLITTADQSE